MRRHEGFILIATLLIMVAVGILVAGTMFTTMIDRQVSASQQGSTSAYYVAQSGLQQAKTRVFRGLVEQLYDEEADECGVTLAEGDVQAWIAFLDDVLPDRDSWVAFPDPEVGQPIGEYRVTTPDPPVRNGYLVLSANGRVGNARATVQLIASAGAGREGVWDNAIFAAGQPSTSAIVGNPGVYGSIQIVNEELELDEDIFIQGTGGVYNDYRGKDEFLNEANTRVVEQLARVVQGQGLWIGDLPDLCARVRIENGNLLFQDAAARVGTSFAPIHSVHLSPDYQVRRSYGQPGERRITDHTTADEIHVRDPEDGGMELHYNSQVSLPRLHADYPDEAYAGDSPGFTGTALNVWDYISDDPDFPGECQWLVDEDPDTGEFLGLRIPPADPGNAYMECSNGDSYIRWTGGLTPRLEIQGWINTDNSGWPTAAELEFNENLPVHIGPYEIQVGVDEEGDPILEEVPIEYEGRGVIRAGRCLDGSGEECTNPDDSAKIEVYGEIAPNGGFPSTHTLGLVSSGDIDIWNGPDLVAAVLAYAEGNVKMTHQTLVAGAVVANSFEFSQVPKVAHHPDVGDAAEVLCMPGSACMQDTIVPPEHQVGPTFSEISYERR